MIRQIDINNQYPHIGLAAYFASPVWRDPERVRKIAGLLVDPRWPWVPHWASYSGVHKRDDRPSVRVGGTANGTEPLVIGMLNPKMSRLRMNRARGDKNFTSVSLDLGRDDQEEWGYEAPLQLWITCRSAELPPDKSIDEWLTLAHDLVSEVGALNATLGAWPTFDMAIHDTWRVRTILDTPRGDHNLGLPADFETQIDLLAKWEKFLGRTYARHPRWGTYLNAEHVAAIGGVERIRAEVQPARIDPVGELTYIQLTASIDTGLTAEAGEKRRRLQELMAPILLGAEGRRPPSAA